MLHPFGDIGVKDTMSLISKTERRCAVHLPSEVLSTIFSFVKLDKGPQRTLYNHQQSPQRTLYCCCLVSRSWYSVAIAPLYQCPFVKGEKYQLFVRTLCAPISVPNFKSPLSEYVRTLGLSALPNDLDESLTEKLLKTVGGALEKFVASGTRFS
jgi:hypothetical protein